MLVYPVTVAGDPDPDPDLPAEATMISPARMLDREMNGELAGALTTQFELMN